MLKTVSIAAILICSGMPVLAQAPQDSVRIWLTELDNQSVIIARQPSLHIELGSPANKIFNNSGTVSSQQLFAYLDSSNRVLAAHVLLTKLQGGQDQRLYYTTEDRTEKIVVDYSYNGFHWQEFFDKTNLSTELKMDNEEMNRIKAYWKTRLTATQSKPGS